MKNTSHQIVLDDMSGNRFDPSFRRRLDPVNHSYTDHISSDSDGNTDCQHVGKHYLEWISHNDGKLHSGEVVHSIAGEDDDHHGLGICLEVPYDNDHR